ncbi:hypothetical protein N431DRAFT_496826 [Stipitochalara longipes BDJ]|nr:hypothetical protein N431DRAFT_496826 [Stipitochalara longipes BDJ]
MTIKPEAAKLPALVKKSIRDQWESKRPAYEAKISQLLGQSWTIEIDAHDACSNVFNEHARSSIGSIFNSYVEGFGKIELNSLCTSHSITLEVGNLGTYQNIGCDIKDGNLRILYCEKNLGVNVHSVVYDVADAVNIAPLPSGYSPNMSFHARQSVRLQYGTQIEEVRLKAASILSTPSIKFTPNFEQIYDQIKEKQNARQIGSYWQKQFGFIGLQYYKDAFLEALSRDFASDKFLVEDFQEAVSQNEIYLRIVDKIDGYRKFEGVIEDGILYIQTTAQSWGTNINYIGLCELKNLL